MASASWLPRYQDYQGTAPGQFIEINHAPSLEFSTVERPFSRTDFVYAYDLSAEGVSRNEIGFSTAPVVGRLDANPYIALPKFLHGWTFRPEVGARETLLHAAARGESHAGPRSSCEQCD